MQNYEPQAASRKRQASATIVFYNKSIQEKVMDGFEKLPDEFFDWLEQCPVQWYRGQVDSNSVSYTFMPDEQEGEDDEN